MDIEECLIKGLLKKDRADINKAIRSIEIAKDKIKTAQKLFSVGIYDVCIVTAYSSMFHVARALLFKDGYKERSHYALYVYLNEKYKDKIEPRFLSEFSLLRLERHDILYGLEKTSIKNEDVKYILKLAEEFIMKVEPIIK